MQQNVAAPRVAVELLKKVEKESSSCWHQCQHKSKKNQKKNKRFPVVLTGVRLCCYHTKN